MRKLTLLVEVKQPEANWIWETHKTQEMFLGVVVKAIGEGDKIKELEDELEKELLNKDDYYFENK